MNRPNNNDDLFELFSNMINNRQSLFNGLSNNEIQTLYSRVLTLSDAQRQLIVNRAISNISLSDFLPLVSRYNSNELDLAENHFDMIRDSFIEETEMKFQDYSYSLSNDVKCVVLDLYYETNAYEFPDIDQIVNRLYNSRCNCVLEYPQNYVKKVIKQCILYTGDTPSCELYPQYIEYYVLHGRIPTDDELEEFIRRVIEYSRNPEEFHQRDKQFVPALHIDLLPIEKYIKGDEDKACCICQDDFSEGQEIITLIPCKHQFHNKGEECLEGGSILNWLDKYNYCPLCKTKVDVLEN